MKTYNAALDLETAAAFEREVKARFDFLCTEHLREQARDEALTRFNAWKVSQLAPITFPTVDKLPPTIAKAVWELFGVTPTHFNDAAKAGK